MLRTLTLHLPTNLPPPLHAEVIWTSPAYEMNWNRSKSLSFLSLAELTVGTCWMTHKRCVVPIAHVQLHRFKKRPARRISTVLAATRNTSLYSDRPSLFACLFSSLAPQSPISLRQSPQLDNGSEVVLLRFNGRKAGIAILRRGHARITDCVQ